MVGWYGSHQCKQPKCREGVNNGKEVEIAIATCTCTCVLCQDSEEEIFRNVCMCRGTCM